MAQLSVSALNSTLATLHSITDTHTTQQTGKAELLSVLLAADAPCCVAIMQDEAEVKR
jgi:hypothetical protein